MEYMPINLMDFYIRKKKNLNVINIRFFKNIQLIKYYLELNIGLEQIIHRDIKLENLLYDEKNNIVKIGNFGLKRLLVIQKENILLI